MCIYRNMYCEAWQWGGGGLCVCAWREANFSASTSSGNPNIQNNLFKYTQRSISKDHFIRFYVGAFDPHLNPFFAVIFWKKL